MCVVLYQRTTMASKTTSKHGAFFVIFLNAIPLSDGMIPSKYSSNGGIK
jgi:hypothetical protein